MDLSRNRQQTVYSTSRTKLLWIVFAVCISIILGTYYSLFTYIAGMLSIAVILFFSEEDSLCFMMFIMPFATVFKNPPGTQSVFTYLVLLYVLYYTVKKHNINEAWALSMLGLGFFLVAQFAVSIDILRSIKFITNIVLIYLVINFKTKDDNKNIYLSYILGIVVSSFVVALNLIPNIGNYIEETSLGYAYGDAMRFSAFYADPNYYSVNVIIALCLVIILNHSKKLSALSTAILAASLTTFAVMTYSKSAFLMLLLPFVMFLYSKIKKKKYILFIVLVVVGIIVLLTFAAGKISALNTILSRFEDSNDISSLTTGRWDLWGTYLKYLFTHPLALFFGRGFGAKLIDTHASHNTFIDLLYYIGIIGTVLFIIMFTTLIKTKKVFFKKNFLNYSVWICVAMMYLFLSELFYFDWVFHIIIAILVSNTNLLNKRKYIQ